MEKSVVFYSGPGLKLRGTLMAPDTSGSGGKRRGIIVCPGPGTGRSPSLLDFILPNVAAWLVRAGYVTLTFHHRGVRESEGPLHRLIPSEQCEDIRNAITFLQQQPEVDPGRIGLWGSATGGANISYVAGVDTRVRCIVSVSGMGDLGRWQRGMRRYWEWVELLKRLEQDRVQRVLTGKSDTIETRQVIVQDPETARYSNELKDIFPEYKIAERLFTLETVEAMLNHRPETVVNCIAPRAAMWICMTGDPLVPTFESESMFEKAGEPKKLVYFEARRHHDLYHGAGFERMMRATTEWFDAHV